MGRSEVAAALIDTQGSLYSEAMGAHIDRDTPQELFHWLIGATLLSAPIGSRQAVRAGRALREAGLHKIDSLLGRDRRDLVKVLNQSGYSRYDESTADYLRYTAGWLRDSYGGDLRKLRDDRPEADAILQALQGAKGIGATGAAIFAREAQLVWDPLYPRVDGPAIKQAAALGLPQDVAALQDLAGGRERFVRLIAALTRAALDGASQEVKEATG